MIRVLTEEYREGDLAVRTSVVTFFHVPIYKYKKTSTNNQAVKQLTGVPQPKKVIGFNENNHKDKEIQQ